MRAVLLLCLLGVTVSGCTEDLDPEGARQFWNNYSGEYRNWQRAPGYESRVASRAAHGDAVDIFVNDVVVQALENNETSVWPVGSVIIKDGYEGDELNFIAGMEKRDDGTWFWVEYNGDGDTLFSGDPEICTGCHSIGDDWVRGFFLPN